jgi:hypothetical protein
MQTIGAYRRIISHIIFNTREIIPLGWGRIENPSPYATVGHKMPPERAPGDHI